MSKASEILQGREAIASLRKTIDDLKRSALVLLVEDDALDVELAKRAFASFRVDLKVSCDAEEAIEMLARGHYDVCFLDLRLPQRSGLDIISECQGRQIETIFIVVTGMDDTNPELKEALDRGAKCIIKKPITEEHLRLIFGTLP